MPTRQQRSELYSRGKICISTNGTALAIDNEDSRELYSALDISEAIAQGCVPVVYGRSAEAEACAGAGFDFTFDHTDEVEEQIFLAARFARDDDLSSSLSRRLDRLSLSRFYREWDQLLSRTPTLEKSGLIQ